MAILFGLTSSQVTTILDNLQLLNDSLREAEKVGFNPNQQKKLILFIQVHKELVAGKANLEYSVHVKTHSLLIDLTKCLPSRKVSFSCPIVDWSYQVTKLMNAFET